MWNFPTCQIGGGTNRENLCLVGYRVRKLRSGPGPGLINFSIFSALFEGICQVVANRWPSCSQSIDRAAIIITLAPSAHKENGTVIME